MKLMLALHYHKLAVKLTSCSLTVLATCYLSASIGGSKKYPVLLPLHKTSKCIFIINQQLP